MKAVVLFTVALFCLNILLTEQSRAKIVPFERGNHGTVNATPFFVGSAHDMPEVPYRYFTPTPVFDQVGRPVMVHPGATPADQPINPWRFILPEKQSE